MDILKSFDISTWGFLPNPPPLLQLPTYFSPWENIFNNLPSLNKNKLIRDKVHNLELLDFTLLSKKPEYQRAYLILTLITNSYVWCEGPANPMTKLPKSIAIPLWGVSLKIGIAPILTHASTDLYNFKLKNQLGDVELDNIETINTMTGTEDESWFFLNMTAIEAKGGIILLKIVESKSAMNNNDKLKFKENLKVIDLKLKEMSKIILRMREKCKPEIFYNVIRPYLSGWENNENLPNGLIYEGVSEEPKKYVGGSAAQSSLLSSIDTAFGINHADTYFQKIKEYMPIKHKQFIEYLKNNINFLEFINLNLDDTELKDLFNKCIDEITLFRKNHMGLVHEYIIKFLKQNNYLNDKGTGGTPLNSFLSQVIQETRDSKI